MRISTALKFDNVALVTAEDEAKSDAAHAAVVGRMASQNVLREEKAAKQTELSKLDADYRTDSIYMVHGGPVPEVVLACRRELAGIEARLAASMATPSGAHWNDVKERDELFVRQASEDADLSKVEVELPKFRKGSERAALIETRAAVDLLVAERARLQFQAPLPLAEVQEAAARQVHELAARGAPDTYGLFNASAPGFLQWPTNVAADNRFDTADALAVLAWMREDELIAAVKRHIAEHAPEGEGLSRAARVPLLRQVTADLWPLESFEERLIVTLAEQGAEVPRRPDFDPRHRFCVSQSIPALREARI